MFEKYTTARTHTHTYTHRSETQIFFTNHVVIAMIDCADTLHQGVGFNVVSPKRKIPISTINFINTTTVPSQKHATLVKGQNPFVGLKRGIIKEKKQIKTCIHFFFVQGFKHTSSSSPNSPTKSGHIVKTENK